MLTPYLMTLLNSTCALRTLKTGTSYTQTSGALLNIAPYEPSEKRPQTNTRWLNNFEVYYSCKFHSSSFILRYMNIYKHCSNNQLCGTYLGTIHLKMVERRRTVQDK